MGKKDAPAESNWWRTLLPCLLSAFVVTAIYGLNTSLVRGDVPLQTGDLEETDWDRCLAETMPRPEPVVRSRSSLKLLEVTFLNMPERIAGHKTPAKCLEDDWQVDKIGRPIILPTAVLLQRAVQVRHPHGGLLDPKNPLPDRPCAKPVPKILHFLWFCSPVPEHIVKRIVLFAQMNPSYKVMLLVDVPPNQTEVDLMNVPEVTARPAGAIVVHHLQSYEAEFRTMEILRWMDNLSHNPIHRHKCAGMSDVARLETLYMYGGIYMDTDFVPDRPFADYGHLFRWPFVSHKVCGINIINSILSFDKKSGFLNFALEAFVENCRKFRNCMPEGGAGPPFLAMAILRYNSSDIALIGQQFFHDSRHQIVSHLTENSWGQR
ncbi:unnamed protein product [Effrenium voratum]|nr:unnamed protein product [Effrenium voratum]